MRVWAADRSDGECGSDGSGNGGGSLFPLARAFLLRAASSDTHLLLCGVILYRKSSFSGSGPRKLIAGMPSIYP